MAKKEMPIGVKIISVLYFIFGALVLLMGVGLLLGRGFARRQAMALLAASGVNVIAGLMFIVFGALIVFVGYGLWKGKSWARTAALVLAVIGLVIGLLAIFRGRISSIVSVFIDAAIIWYLGFKEGIKKIFS